MMEKVLLIVVSISHLMTINTSIVFDVEKCIIKLVFLLRSQEV